MWYFQSTTFDWSSGNHTSTTITPNNFMKNKSTFQPDILQHVSYLSLALLLLLYLVFYTYDVWETSLPLVVFHLPIQHDQANSKRLRWRMRSIRSRIFFGINPLPSRLFAFEVHILWYISSFSWVFFRSTPHLLKFLSPVH